MEQARQGLAPEFDMETVERLLTTTRSVRKRFDLTRQVSRDVIADCLRIALQAPTGSNAQRWRWIVVTDAGRRRALGEIYSKAFREYLAVGAGTGTAAAIHSGLRGDAARRLGAHLLAQQRLMGSVRYLIDHIGDVPVHVVPCAIGRISSDASPSWISSHFGSVYPAVWNFQLALRSRGLGSCITTAHLGYEEEAAEILRIRYERLTQVCLLPVGYYTGKTFKVGRRRPMNEVVFWDEFDPDSLVEGSY